MIREGLSRHNVVGAYDSMEAARKAIDALQFAGIEADDISLHGPPAEQAARRTDKETLPVDRPIVQRVAIRAIGWGIAGGIVGAILGLILWSADVGIGAMTDSAAFQIGMWTLAGLIAGTLIGAYSAITVSEAWEMTYEPVAEGRVLVGVHSDNEKEIASADKVLRKEHALEVARFDENGRPEAA